MIAASGGTTWTRIMFERQVLGEDYWAKQAATNPVLFPSGAPMSDAIVRGEVTMGPILYNAIFPKQRDGAPVEMVFAPEGAPVNPYASGIPKTAAHPNAAKLFLNWCLSVGGPDLHDQAAGQSHLAQEGADLSAGLRPARWSSSGCRTSPNTWSCTSDWVEDWNKTYNYRQ